MWDETVQALNAAMADYRIGPERVLQLNMQLIVSIETLEDLSRYVGLLSEKISAISVHYKPMDALSFFEKLSDVAYDEAAVEGEPLNPFARVAMCIFYAADGSTESS